MSKREYFLRYSLILKRLQKGEATFDEISGYLERESELLDYDLTISKRTFQRDLNEIRDIFQVDIQYDFSRKVYFVSDGNRSEVTGRMLEAFDMFNALNLTDDLSQFIHFEKRKAQGTEHFYGLLHCIKNRLVVRFPYLKFEEDEITKREAEPYALKEFKGRWYLLANDQKDGMLKTFGLDRIQELEITKKKFQWPVGFNANELFRDYFGIISTAEREPEEVVLSFDPFQGKYVKSFPLHESQKVITDNDTETRIRLSVHITYDFVVELLSFGGRVKIISPVSLQKEVRNAYRSALSQYKK
ncbi:MAG: WYL domain-containing protein [Cyclobacteriaceae bacterium]|nr:WYL domain-containing protein [Cyclobacteriaceae bacterium]